MTKTNENNQKAFANSAVSSGTESVKDEEGSLDYILTANVIRITYKICYQLILGYLFLKNAMKWNLACRLSTFHVMKRYPCYQNWYS